MDGSIGSIRLGPIEFTNRREIVDKWYQQRVIGAVSAALALGSAVAFVPQAPKPHQPKMDWGKAVQRILLAPAVVLGINAAPMVAPAHAGASP